MDEYRYPDVLYCIVCDEDVDAVIEPKQEKSIGDDGKEIVIDYTVAICPVCGKELCRRDYYRAIAKAVSDHFKGETQ